MKTITNLKQDKKNIKTLVEERKCEHCKRAKIEVYNEHCNVCYNCWMAETFLSFVDQVAIPEV
jgi:hypothetical protein